MNAKKQFQKGIKKALVKEGPKMLVRDGIPMGADFIIAPVKAYTTNWCAGRAQIMGQYAGEIAVEKKIEKAANKAARKAQKLAENEAKKAKACNNKKRTNRGRKNDQYVEEDNWDEYCDEYEDEEYDEEEDDEEDTIVENRRKQLRKQSLEEVFPEVDPTDEKPVKSRKSRKG